MWLVNTWMKSKNNGVRFPSGRLDKHAVETDFTAQNIQFWARLSVLDILL